MIEPDLEDAEWLAVETIPDIFRTIGNVTADVAITAVIARGAGDGDGDVEAV